MMKRRLLILGASLVVLPFLATASPSSAASDHRGTDQKAKRILTRAFKSSARFRTFQGAWSTSGHGRMPQRKGAKRVGQSIRGFGRYDLGSWGWDLSRRGSPGRFFLRLKVRTVHRAWQGVKIVGVGSRSAARIKALQSTRATHYGRWLCTHNSSQTAFTSLDGLAGYGQVTTFNEFLSWNLPPPVVPERSFPFSLRLQSLDRWQLTLPSAKSQSHASMWHVRLVSLGPHGQVLRTQADYWISKAKYTLRRVVVHEWAPWYVQRRFAKYPFRSTLRVRFFGYSHHAVRIHLPGACRH